MVRTTRPTIANHSGIIAELETLKRKLKDPYMTSKTRCPFCRHENLTSSAKMILTPTVY